MRLTTISALSALASLTTAIEPTGTTTVVDTSSIHTSFVHPDPMEQTSLSSSSMGVISAFGGSVATVAVASDTGIPTSTTGSDSMATSTGTSDGTVMVATTMPTSTAAAVTTVTGTASGISSASGSGSSTSSGSSSASASAGASQSTSPGNPGNAAQTGVSNAQGNANMAGGSGVTKQVLEGVGIAAAVGVLVAGVL